jgi:peptide deformylase
MIKEINVVPNPILRQKAIPCVLLSEMPEQLSQAILYKPTDIWPKQVVDLVTDLKDTAESQNETCLGLASNQIWDQDGPPLAVFVVKLAMVPSENYPKDYIYAEFINPKVVTSGKGLALEEACFSKPGLSKKTKRERNVTIYFQTLDNPNQQSFKFYYKNSFTPIIIQHEYDHLNGKVI